MIGCNAQLHWRICFDQVFWQFDTCFPHVNCGSSARVIQFMQYSD